MSQVGLRVLAERENVVDSSALGPHGARGGARLLAGRRPDRGPAPLLSSSRSSSRRSSTCTWPRAPPRPAPTRCWARRRARPLLPRPARRPRRDRLGAGPQPLLHQHLADLQARAALRRARPQRRDQHHRPPAPGGADARRPDPGGRLGLPGPQPHGRGADLPPRPHARRGDGARPAADRGRDQGPARATCAASTCTCARPSARSRRARSR